MAVEPGTLIGRYEIQRKLGRGGMGTVYVAHDPVLGRMVAIKLFETDHDQPDAGQRFSREARSAALLNHPNIVTVYDFGDVESQSYIVMEYVSGEPLSQLIRRKADVSPTVRLRWIEELCSGAGYAHRMSIVHRDIKPANLIIDKSSRLKVLDFGIARIAGTTSNTAKMQGTPGYMAPEQIRGEEVDQRSDVFAIGVVFYELIAFTEAFPGDSPMTVMHRILSDDPPALDRVVSDCHPEIASICARAMVKDPADRYQSAEAMRDAVSRLRSEIEADTGYTVLPTPLPETFAPSVGYPLTPQSPSTAAKPATDSGSKPTPPSGSQRTDRELLARRRADLIRSALEDARLELGRGRFHAALAACQEAIVLDETHAEAVELEREIEAAIAASSAGTPRPPVAVRPDPALAPDDYDRTVLAPAARRVESTPRVSPSSPADDRTVIATRPTPKSQTAPASVPPPAAAPSKASSSGQTKAAASPAPSRKTPADATSGVRAWIAQAQAMRIAGVAAWKVAVPLLVAIVGGIGLVAWMTRGPVPTGTVVIEAVPWAYVTAVEAENGEKVNVPAGGSTPASLALPAGTYRITLTGPPPAAQVQHVKVVVTVGQRIVVPTTRFPSLTVEEYFNQYLDASSAPTVDAGEGSLPGTATPGGTASTPSTEAQR